MTGVRVCEFCGCRTNAKLRACCNEGREADLKREKLVLSDSPLSRAPPDCPQCSGQREWDAGVPARGVDIKVIPLSECVDRGIYRLISRNLVAGVFDAEKRGFAGIREKCGYKYLFMEYHRDIGPPLGTAAPLEKIGDLPERIPMVLYKRHPDGDLWARDARGKLRPVRGVVAFRKWWADTGKPVPKGCQSHLVTNQALYRFLLPFDRASSKKVREEIEERKKEMEGEKR